MGGKSFQVPCFETRTRVPFFSRLSPLFGSCINFFLSNIWQPFSIDCRGSTRTCTPAATRRAPRPSTSEQAGRTPGTARCSEGRGACIFSFPCPMTQGIGSCQPQAGPSYLLKKSNFYEFSFVFVLGVQKTVSMTYPCCLHYIITTIAIHFT